MYLNFYLIECSLPRILFINYQLLYQELQQIEFNQKILIYLFSTRIPINAIRLFFQNRYKKKTIIQSLELKITFCYFSLTCVLK